MADMSYITRVQMQHKNLQVLTSFDWDWQIDFSSHVGYHPPMQLLKTACTQISGDCDQPLPTLTPMQIPLRGFTLIQPGLTDAGSLPQTLVLELQDFEDQSIFSWCYDWLNRCNSVQNRASYRRESIFVDIDLWRLNSSRVRVMQIHYFNCMPLSAQYSNQYNDQKSQVGVTGLVLQPEWRLVTALNI